MRQLVWPLALLLLAPGLMAQEALYGPAIGGDSLANTPIGKAGIQVSLPVPGRPRGGVPGAPGPTSSGASVGRATMRAPAAS